MNKGDGDNLGEKAKGNVNLTMAATIKPLITTSGEVFADGSMIDLIGDAQIGNPRLLLWDGSREIVGARVEHHGQYYEPAPIDRSVLQQLVLPTHCCPHGSTREFLGEICGLIANLVGLQEKPASLVGRIVLLSALVDAVSVAPMLMIVGPDTTRANLLVTLLRCLCRHPLLLTGATPAGFCSLPSGPRFTYLISQSTISDKLQNLLHNASSRDRKIPFRGRLLDLFGVQVIHCESGFGGDSWPPRSIQISMIPTGQELPAFDLDAQHRITEEFQAKSLSFRRANLGPAHKLQYDASKFSLAVQDLAHTFAAATPDDLDLQAEVFELLREHDQEIRSERWIALSSVAVEAVLVAGRESPGEEIYVADLAETAQEILRRRGEVKAEITPGPFGKTLKVLGFATEPRDAKGKKLRLTDALVGRAKELARALGGPEVEAGGS